MALKTVDYDENQHKVYAAGRAMPEATRSSGCASSPSNCRRPGR